MNQEFLSQLLTGVRDGRINVQEALDKLKDFTIKDLGYATVDTHRELRTGYPEVIFGQGKTPDQVTGIIQYMLTRDNNILATRVTEEMYAKVREICSDAVYNPSARTISIKRKAVAIPSTYIAIVTAGTSDLPVA